MNQPNDLDPQRAVDICPFVQDLPSFRVETQPGVFAQGEPGLQALAADAATEALNSTAAPIDHADMLVAAVTGEALRGTVRVRVEQIARHGHTPDSDEMLPIYALADDVIAQAKLARSAIGVTGRDRNLNAAKRRLLRAAALCWAAFDRLERATKDERGE
jgi:hypothetical protein